MRGRQLARTVCAVALVAGALIAAPVTADAGPSPHADQTGTIARNGIPVAVNITQSNQNAKFVMSTVAGQQVSAYLSSSTFGTTCGAVKLSLLRPNGSAFGNVVTTCGTTAFLDSQTFDVSGDWTILVDPQGTRTGTANLQAYNTNDATALAHLDGSTLAVETVNPGQDGRYKFNGTAGQKVSAYVTAANFTGCPAFALSLQRPDGTTLGSSVTSCNSTAFLEPQILDQTGQWGIVVDPQGMTTGTATLQAYDVVDDTGAILTTGKPAYLRFDAPGANARWTFDGTSGERVSAYVNKSTVAPCGVALSLVRPNGTTLGSPATECGDATFLETRVLDASGTWTAFVDPQGTGTGTATLRVFDIVDESLTFKPKHPLKTFTSLAPGRTAAYHFNGNIGDSRTVSITGSTYPGCPSLVVSFVRPDATIRASTTTCTKTLSLTTSLDAAGGWTVFIDPQEAAMGTMIVRLT
jgi:hypothetical protein